MDPAEAIHITEHLLAGFPDAILDEDQFRVFVSEVALLHDPYTGMAAAQDLVRTYPRFPAISEYRAAYHTLVRRAMEDRDREEREQLASTVNPQTREELAAEMRRFAEELKLRVQGDDAAQLNLPAVGEGTCHDCRAEGELVSPGPGPLEVCRACAASRMRVAALLRRDPEYAPGVSESSFASPPDQVEHGAEVAQEVEVE